MEKCFWRFSQQKKLENLLPNFAGNSPPISPKTSPTSLWKSLVLTSPDAKIRKNHEKSTKIGGYRKCFVIFPYFGFRERIRGAFWGVFGGSEGFCILQGAKEIAILVRFPENKRSSPKGPKIEKNQSRLKISISLDSFNLSCTRLRVPPVALHVSRYTCRS